MTINLILFTYCILNLIGLLRASEIKRLDQSYICLKDMPYKESFTVARYICYKYNYCIVENNKILKEHFIKYNKCVNSLIMIIFLSLLLVFISNFIR